MVTCHLEESDLKNTEKMGTGRKTWVSDNYSLTLEGLKNVFAKDCVGILHSLVSVQLY